MIYKNSILSFILVNKRSSLEFFFEDLYILNFDSLNLFTTSKIGWTRV